MSTAQVHIELLRQQPRVPVFGCPELRVHQAPDVFALWEQWEQRTGQQQAPPFWACVWPGAAVMARLLLEEPEIVRERRVIDLGCGSGAVAIAAHMAGAGQAVANDLDSAAVDAALLNAESHGVNVLPLLGDLTRRSEPFGEGDVLLICEMFYDAKSSREIVTWLAAAYLRGARILIGDGGRPFLPLLLSTQRLTPLREALIPVNAELEGVAERRVCVFEWG